MRAPTYLVGIGMTLFKLLYPILYFRAYWLGRMNPFWVPLGEILTSQIPDAWDCCKSQSLEEYKVQTQLEQVVYLTSFNTPIPRLYRSNHAHDATERAWQFLSINWSPNKLCLTGNPTSIVAMLHLSPHGRHASSILFEFDIWQNVQAWRQWAWLSGWIAEGFILFILSIHSISMIHSAACSRCQVAMKGTQKQKGRHQEGAVNTNHEILLKCPWLSAHPTQPALKSVTSN